MLSTRIDPRRLWPRTHAEQLNWIIQLITDVRLLQGGNGDLVARPLNRARLDEWRAHRLELMKCLELTHMTKRIGTPAHNTLCIYVDGVVEHLQRGEIVRDKNLDFLMHEYWKADQCRSDPRHY